MRKSALLRSSPDQLKSMNDDDLIEAFKTLVSLSESERQENQLLYYQPASPDARKIHEATSKYVCAGGGNGSSKTESCLVDLIACATGVIPASVPEIKKRFRGPINCRVVCESLTTVLHPIILPKLKWWVWTGVGAPGSEKGHYGWVPKLCLKDGDWDKSWSEKLRMLTVQCRDPDNFDEVLGQSTIQFMSVDQDASDFASGDFHIVLHDEPPTYAIWTENEARTMRVAGRMMLAMTWPDDPAIPVDWLYEIYEQAIPSPKRNPEYTWINLHTTDNRTLDQESIKTQMANWSEQMKLVRIHGQPVRFSNLIHPLFTDIPRFWSFAAGKEVTPDRDEDDNLVCPITRSREVTEYCHVVDEQPSMSWPTVFLLDPHPRKPHMWAWVQVDGNDDYFVCLEGEGNLTASEVAEVVLEVEESYGMRVCQRIMDPKMGASPARSGQNREITWQDEFNEGGLYCALGDSSDVGRSRVNEYLQPDPHTYRPRLVFAAQCQNAIYQMKRFSWDDYKRNQERDLKQQPRQKFDDYPALMRYLMNDLPSFESLNHGHQIIRRKRTRG